jgi:HK97 family phage portal protein
VGKRAVEERQLRPDVTPNANDPASTPPGTVGPPSAVPGDPHGVLFVSEGESGVFGGGPPRPSAWSGLPLEFGTPNWFMGRVDDLTDVAWGCVDLIASLLASMPPYLVGAASSLDDEWLINPDPDLYTSWHEFAKQLWWDFMLGEAFVVATSHYSTGWPARFHVVDPWLVNVEMDGGRRRYSIGNLDVTADMLHIRYQSRTSDAHGHGPLEVGRTRLLASRLLGRYISNFVGGGAVPSGIITHPSTLTAEQAAGLQDQWLAARSSMMGLPAVLSGGVEFQATQQSPAQMGMVELAQMTESRVSVLMRVPPFLMGLPSGGDSMTYANVQSIFDYFWRSGLKSRADPVVQALSGWALPRGTTVEVNRDEFVRPGPLERAQTWQILIGLGVITVEQVQEIERFTIAAPSTTLTSGVLQ